MALCGLAFVFDCAAARVIITIVIRAGGRALGVHRSAHLHVLAFDFAIVALRALTFVGIVRGRLLQLALPIAAALPATNAQRSLRLDARLSSAAASAAPMAARRLRSFARRCGRVPAWLFGHCRARFAPRDAALCRQDRCAVSRAIGHADRWFASPPCDHRPSCSGRELWFPSGRWPGCLCLRLRRGLSAAVCSGEWFRSRGLREGGCGVCAPSSGLHVCDAVQQFEQSPHLLGIPALHMLEKALLLVHHTSTGERHCAMRVDRLSIFKRPLRAETQHFEVPFRQRGGERRECS